MASSASNLWVLLGLGLAGVLLMTRKFKKAARENFGAVVKRLELVPPPNPPPPKAPLPLSGLSFAVSDVFDINGHVTEFGHPDWARTHEAASQTALVVSAMVEGGATCVGKTVVSEMAFSISGENKHYGTPVNPEAPSKVPGGACSGSSVAVSAALVDFALGVDTVGGVRLPAAYCGIIGFRPSHGTVSLSGVIPVSPSLDVVGCFAKDPNVLRRAVHVLLQLQFANQRKPRQILIADDCFEQLKIPIDRVTQPVIRSTEKLFGRQILKHVNIGDHISTKVPTLKDFYGNSMNGAIKSSSLGLLAAAMQSLSLHEFNQNHEEWMKSVNPSLNPVITSRIHNMPKLDEIHVQKLHKIRDDVRSALNSLLKVLTGCRFCSYSLQVMLFDVFAPFCSSPQKEKRKKKDEGILVLPTFFDSPPKLGSKEISSVDFENRFFCLSSIASMSGCCQVAVPLGTHDKSPVSVSLLARHGGDRFLLDTLRSMYASLQEQTELVSTSKPSSNGAISKEISAEIAKEKGNRAYKNKDWTQAINCYSEAIKLDPDNATYYNNRGLAYLEAGSFQRAEADCSKAIDLDKKNVKAYLRRGTAREMLGNYKEALDDFRYALILEPGNKRAATSVENLKNLYG